MPAILRRILLLAVVVALGAGVYYYVNRQPDALVLTGVVTTNDVVVSPQIGGQIAQLLANEGDTVKKDQLLAVIAPDELRADISYYAQNAQGLNDQVNQSAAALRYQEQQTTEQIRQAEATVASTEAQQAAAAAELENARAVFERTQNLAKQNVVSAQELDQARTTFTGAQAKLDSLKKQADAARAAVALARSNAEQTMMRRSQLEANRHQEAAAAAQKTKADVRLSYTELHAPIDGVVDVRPVRPGEVVTAGQPVLTLINPDDLWVRADVEETYIDRVRIGDKHDGTPALG